jgi:hypothetical protein
VRIAGANQIALATADTVANSQVFGFVAAIIETGSNPEYIVHHFMFADNLVGSLGNLVPNTRIYLTNLGGYSDNFGTIFQPVGIAISTDSALLFANPAGGLGGAGGGVTGIQGQTGIQGVRGMTGVGAQGVTGLIGVTGLQGIGGGTGYQGITGVQGVPGVTGMVGLAYFTNATKAADTTFGFGYGGQSTYTDDPELQVSLLANTYYYVDILFAFTGNYTYDTFNKRLTYTGSLSGCDLTGETIYNNEPFGGGYMGGGVNAVQATSLPWTEATSFNTYTPWVTRLKGWIKTSTSGTLKWQFYNSGYSSYTCTSLAGNYISVRVGDGAIQGATGIQGVTGAYGGPPGATGIQGITGPTSITEYNTVKTADDSHSSIAADSTLSIILPAGNYQIEGWFFFIGGSGGYLVTNWAFSGTASYLSHTWDNGTGNLGSGGYYPTGFSASPSFPYPSGTLGFYTGNGWYQPIWVTGSIFVTVSGTFALRWGASGGSITLKQGSWLRCTKV